MKIWNWLIGVAVMLTGCVEPYDLPVQNTDVNFLVVDGFLNSSNGEVNVQLLRAAIITDEDLPVEENAIVTLEDLEGNSHPLHELDSGHYQGTTPAVEEGRQYRLYIKTANGREYRSQFITLKSTPEIKEVGWRADDDGTQIVVDTEDNTNNTRYYRWTFEETWEYHSRLTSYFKFTGEDVDSIMSDEVDARDPHEMINKCYRTLPSKQIYTTTTTGLTEDLVNDFELVFLPIGTEKLSQRYSILVKQYAISKETYEFLEKLKKTSQDLGGLFAPQPSKVTGNISNISDPSEIVLGYFDGGQAKEKRLSITPQDLPAHLQTVSDDNLACYADTVAVSNLHILASSGESVLIYQLQDEFFNTYAYTYTRKECGDCRVKGGVTTKPFFWP